MFHTIHNLTSRALNESIIPRVERLALDFHNTAWSSLAVFIAAGWSMCWIVFTIFLALADNTTDPIVETIPPPFENTLDEYRYGDRVQLYTDPDTQCEYVIHRASRGRLVPRTGTHCFPMPSDVKRVANLEQQIVTLRQRLDQTRADANRIADIALERGNKLSGREQARQQLEDERAKFAQEMENISDRLKIELMFCDQLADDDKNACKKAIVSKLLEIRDQTAAADVAPPLHNAERVVIDHDDIQDAQARRDSAKADLELCTALRSKSARRSCKNEVVYRALRQGQYSDGNTTESN